MPLTIAISGQFSLMSLPSNFFVEPVVAPITVIGFVAALVALFASGFSYLLAYTQKPFAEVYRLGCNEFCQGASYPSRQRICWCISRGHGAHVWVDRFKMAYMAITLIQGGEELLADRAISEAVSESHGATVTHPIS